jgi:hypothetical protein
MNSLRLRELERKNKIALKIATYRLQFEVGFEIIRAMSIAACKPLSGDDIRKMEYDLEEHCSALATCPEEGGCLAVWSEEKE